MRYIRGGSLLETNVRSESPDRESALPLLNASIRSFDAIAVRTARRSADRDSRLEMSFLARERRVLRSSSRFLESDPLPLSRLQFNQRFPGQRNGC